MFRRVSLRSLLAWTVVVGCLLTIASSLISMRFFKLYGDVYDVAFLPNGQMVTACEDGAIRVTNAEMRTRELKGHSNQVVSVDYSPDGETLVSASRDGTVREWHLLEPGTPSSLISVPLGLQGCVRYVGEEKILCTDSGNDVVRVNEGRASPGMTKLSAAFLECEVVDDSVVGVGEDFVSMWLLRDSPQEEWRIDFANSALTAMALSPDRETVAVASNHGIILLDVLDGRELSRMGEGCERITSLAFSSDGEKIVSASVPDSIHNLHDDHIRWQNSVALSTFNGVRLWDISDQSLIESKAMEDAAWCVAFHPTENRIAVGTEDWKVLHLDGEDLSLDRTTHYRANQSFQLAIACFVQVIAMLFIAWDGKHFRKSSARE